MGFLTPDVGEASYQQGTGALTLTLGITPEEHDVFLICVEYSGNGTPPSMSGWTTVAGPEASGGGFDDAEVVVLAHRYDGTNTPTLIVPDTGNHQSASLLVARGVDRDLALGDIHSVAFSDTSADTDTKSNSTSPDTESAGVGSLATGQLCAVVWFTGGSENHGGASYSNSGTGTWGTVEEIRSTGHTQGSAGSHFTAWGNADSDSDDLQHTWACTNSMTESRVAVFLPAHEYTEFTRSVSESLTLGDSIGRDGGFTRAVSDALGLSDTPASLGAFTRAVADALTLSDAVGRIQGFVFSVSDSLSLADAPTRIQGWVRGVSDSLSFSELLTRTATQFRAVVDSLTLADSAARAIFKYRYVTDSLTLSDTISEVVKYGIKAILSAAVKPLASIVASVLPKASIADDVKVLTTISVETTEDVGTEITDDVDELTDIEVDIE